MTPWGFEPQFTDRKSVVLDQARRWGHTLANYEGRWTRTIDARLKRAVLYQLSYAPIIHPLFLFVHIKISLPNE